MKFARALTLAIILPLYLCRAKDILIADSFELTFPDDSTPSYVPTEGMPNKALPSVRNDHFQFWSYWQDWINKEQNLENIPMLLDRKIKTTIAEFQIFGSLKQEVALRA